VSRVGATSAEDPIEELFARGVTFRSPENLKMLVAGGTAGPFTALIPGWPFADAPARLVLKTIRRRN
jgi:hypothetical protein